MKNNVLYCGMADDILTPLLLIPELTTLFVIDIFDSAFAKNKTWEGQKEDILNCLKDGNNENSYHREVYLKYDKTTKIYSILESCIITNQFDNGKYWTVDFLYNGKKRKLIYFHHTNFISIWDTIINNISHLICVGAEFPIHNPTLNKMIKKRCNYNCKFYDQFALFINTKKVDILGRTIFINDLKNIL